MNISANQLASRPKKVGTLDGKNVMEVVTKGGYHILVAPKGASFETLAVGPHRAVSRHIATKHHKAIQWTELSKGDFLELGDIEHLLPRYEKLTSMMRKNQEEK